MMELSVLLPPAQQGVRLLSFPFPNTKEKLKLVGKNKQKKLCNFMQVWRLFLRLKHFHARIRKTFKLDPSDLISFLVFLLPFFTASTQGKV